MYLPTLKELPTRRDMVEVFGGYNRNLRIPDGEFYDMKNMTSDHYPVLAPRGKRGKYVLVSEDSGAETIPKAQALIEKDALCFVDGSKFYINGYGHDVPGLNGSEETRLVSMGAYVIALPDKVYINTKNPTDCGKIEALYEADTESGTTVTFTPCSLDGTVYKVDANNRTETAPKNPSDLDFWIDTSSSPHTLKQWSATSAIWVTIATTYIKISATGIGKSFNQYDGVSIAGLKDVDGTPTELAEIDGSFVVWNKDDNYIMVVGFIDDAIELKTKTLKVKRSMPTMDFVVESENRLWGCKYGESDNGEIVNEIYASKLGDFRNWSCFMGVSTDSYTVSLGTDGRFTGAATHLGYPIFFKENCMHKIYGNYPSNYQVQTTSCRGVQLGCDRSIATVNEILYYKSQSGVCAYDGSLPTDISERLGDEQYSDAVAGAHNGKYYISLKDKSDEYHLFVYDTQRGLWHKEDNIRPTAFCSCRNELYYINSAGEIMSVTGDGKLEEDPIEWMVETGEIGMEMPDQKYVSRLVIRMSLVNGASASFYISYDSDDSEGKWKKLFDMSAHRLRSFEVPIRPRRCDHFRVRIEGAGDGKIYSIAKTIEQGSDHTR